MPAGEGTTETPEQEAARKKIFEVPEGQPEFYEQKPIFYPRKEHIVGHTVIRGKVREIWNRRVSHKNGQWNNCGPTYWVKLREKGEVVGEGKYAQTVEEDEWAPWLLHHGRFNVMNCWSYEVEEGHTTRIKWDELQINHFITATLYLNKRKVYQTRHNDHLELMLELHRIMKGLQDLSVNLFKIEDDLPRAIYYDGQPAVITAFNDDGNVWIEMPGDRTLKKPASWETDDIPWEPRESFYADILSAKIDWHRSQRVPGDEKWVMKN